jgi:hypothetical protein
MTDLWSWLNTPHWDWLAIVGGVLLGGILGALLDIRSDLKKIAKVVTEREDASLED